MHASQPSVTGRTARSTALPKGAIPLVEPQAAHDEFLRENEYVDAVLLKLPHVARLLRQGETARSAFPSQDIVITTTTCRDSFLSELTIAHEEQLVRAFAPDLHVACDFPTYRDTEPAVKRARIEKNLTATFNLTERLGDTETEVIPLVKGVDRLDWELYRRVFEFYDVELCAFYATQYYTDGGGLPELRRDVRGIASVLSGQDLFLIGALSPGHLQEMPPQVRSAAGLHQWRTHSRLRDVPIQVSQERYAVLKAGVEEAVTSGQTPLDAWLPNRVEVA